MNDLIPLQLQISPPWEAQVDAARLHRAVGAALHAEGAAPGSHLTLLVVGDEEMSALHEQFRQEPGPTDVLSFPYEDEGTGEMVGYLGDIVVCYPQAVRQAEEEGHPPQAELDLLAVHGTLHLLGYDDEEPTARATMWQRQRAVLEGLGLGHITPGEAG